MNESNCQTKRTWLRPRNILISLILFLPFGLYFQWYIYFYHVGGSELAAVIAEIEKDDPNWTWEAIMAQREEIPDEENSALVILKVVGTDKNPGLLPKGWDNGWIRLWNRPPAPERMYETEIEMLRTKFEPTHVARKELRRIAEMSRGLIPGVPNATISDPAPSIPDVQRELRMCWKVLGIDFELAMAEGDHARAARDLSAILSSIRTLEQPILFIEMFVRTAGQATAIGHLNRLLSQVVCTEEVLAGLQVLLEQEASYELTRKIIESQVASLNRRMSRIVERRADPEEVFSTLLESSSKDDRLTGFRVVDNTWLWIRLAYQTGPVKRQHAGMLRTGHRAIEIASLPVGEQVQAIKDLESEASNWVGVRESLIATYKFVLAETLEARAKLGNAIIATAAERYRLAKGQWPESLAQLTPKYLGEVPIDPFSGKPLILKRTDYGLIIYSIGIDEKDDGGKVIRAFVTERPPDTVFRLWDPDKRAADPTYTPVSAEVE